MKFIESYELREWVKDNLRKTIFQKAHALAVQTGCEILVKLHDTQDISGCQYYATNNLKRIYRTTKLRQPGETLVSGETGQPLMDKCIQYGEDASTSTDSSLPDDSSGGREGDQNRQSSFQEEGGSNESVHPMHLSSAGDAMSTNNFDSQTQTQGANDDSDIEITQITNPQNLLSSNVQVKQEPMFEQQNTMFGQTQQQGMMGNEGMMGNQGMMDNQAMLQQSYQVPIAPKPYQCSICRKAFKSVHVLQKHTLTFHTPGSKGASRNRGSRGNRGRGRGSRGRGQGLHMNRPNLTAQPQHQQPFQAMPSVKTEGAADLNSTTCMMCNQTFEQPDQLNAHIPQCPMAQHAMQNPSESFTDNSGAPAAAGSMDASGFAQQFHSASQDDMSSATGSMSDPSWQFMPPDGTSPSGLNLPSASSFFGQQNPSMYNTPSQSPGQSPRASTSGGAGSSGSRKLSHQRFPNRIKQHADMTPRNIMAAILQTSGPVTIHRVLARNWKFLNMLTAKQYLAAANNLAGLKLGSVVLLKGSHFFVKRPPADIQAILEANIDLCTPEYYKMRFWQPVSKYVPQAMQDNLVAKGIVPRHFFVSREQQS